MKRLLLLASFLFAAATLAAQTAPSAEHVSHCACGNGSHAIACLSESQMSRQLKHGEMAPDSMGKRVNLKGVAVLAITFDERGYVVNAASIFGHPLVIPRLLEAIKNGKWQFTPYKLNGVASRACGRLRVRYSFVNGAPAFSTY